MAMTAEDIELLQTKIVELCHAAGRLGLPEERIKRALIQAGYGVDKDTLERHLRYLKSKEWIEEVEKRLRPDLVRWQSTSKGDEHLMLEGLI
jgi:Fic family protein